MSIAYAARGGVNTSGAIVSAISVTVSANTGDTIIVSFSNGSGLLSDIHSITDDAGNNYQEVGSKTTAGTIWVYATLSSVGSVSTISITMTSRACQVCVSTYTGVVGIRQPISGSETAGTPFSPLANALWSANSWVFVTCSSGNHTVGFTFSPGNLRENYTSSGSSNNRSACNADNTSNTFQSTQSGGYVAFELLGDPIAYAGLVSYIGP